jgi:8-oxo-dGTP pyrophosphatase MutT (NUDIX family)
MATRKTVLLDIPPEKQAGRGWKVWVNGQEIREVSRVTIDHPKFGTLEYGLDPGGYDRWSFHENGGGGSVIVPFAVCGGVVYVGVVEQKRVNQGGVVPNLPRGFLQPGENHFQAAGREAGEELGGEVRHEPFPLDGEPMNPNSTFFETWDKLPDGSPEGVRFFGLPFQAHELEGSSDRLTFKPGVVRVRPDLQDKRVAELILTCSFIPWDKAMRLGDMFTSAGTGRLLAHLRNVLR